MLITTLKIGFTKLVALLYERYIFNNEYLFNWKNTGNLFIARSTVYSNITYRLKFTILSFKVQKLKNIELEVWILCTG